MPDVLAKGYTGRELRYALLRVHYRVPLNFTWEGMKEARESLGRIDEWLTRLKDEIPGSRTSNVRTSNVQHPTQKFEEALDDDLNISAALGFLFESIRETNRAMDENKLDAASQKHGWIGGNGSTQSSISNPRPNSRYQRKWRSWQNSVENARREKNWKQSDELRDQISALGWEVRDTKDGQNSRRVVRLDPGSAGNRRGICARVMRMIHSSFHI